MKLTDNMDTEYLRVEMLDGKEIPVKIKGFEVRQLHNTRTNKKDSKVVMFFERAKRGLVLNNTNLLILSRQFGDDSEKSIGQDIILYPKKEVVMGKERLIIRIKFPTTSPQTPKLP